MRLDKVIEAGRERAGGSTVEAVLPYHGCNADRFGPAGVEHHPGGVAPDGRIGHVSHNGQHRANEKHLDSIDRVEDVFDDGEGQGYPSTSCFCTQVARSPCSRKIILSLAPPGK